MDLSDAVEQHARRATEDEHVARCAAVPTRGASNQVSSRAVLLCWPVGLEPLVPHAAAGTAHSVAQPQALQRRLRSSDNHRSQVRLRNLELDRGTPPPAK